MSFEALQIGASGLAAAQTAVDVAGHNVANVNTDGYTRENVVLTASPPSQGTAEDGMRGTGVMVSDVQRLRSTFADSAWRSQAAVTGAATQTSTIMTQVQNTLGDLGTGLPAAVNALYSAFSDLSVNPSDPATRMGVITAGQTVAHQLNALAQQLQQVGPDSVSQAVDMTGTVNSLAGQVATLNTAIEAAEGTGQDPADLLDQRDRALDQLATLTGARAGQPDAHGSVDVYLGGEPIVRGREASKLAVTATSNGPAIGFADGRTATLSGQLGGLVQTAAVTVPRILAGFDAFAKDLATAVNTVHAAGYGTDGGTGRAFFTGTSASTLAVSSTLTPDQVAASASGAVSDGNNALALSQLRDQVDAAGATLGDKLRAQFSNVGLTTAQAQTEAASATNVENGLQNDRLAQDSVNVDDEMVNMVRYQRAYEASSRVVTIADQMLDTLINHTGQG